MKTKHYLIVAASVAIGIILGVTISMGIMHKRQARFMQERMEYGNFNNSNFGPGNQGCNQGQGQRWMKRGNRRGMNNNGMQTGRKQMRGMKQGMMGKQPGMMGMPMMFTQLNLTDEQQEQIDAIFEKRRDDFEQQQNLRESRWEATTKEVRDILTDEQRADYEELMNKPGKKTHAPGLYMVLNRFDLTDDQKEKIEVLQKRNGDMRDAMWTNREQQMETTMEQVKSILTDEQKEKLEELRSSRGGRFGRRNA
jgi:Spy/CpxP family protein refolding chaperone